MTWAKLDDGFENHPKILGARVSPLLQMAMYGLHARAISYCARYETDGKLPQGWVDQVTAGADLTALPQHMIDAGLWKARSNGYEVHDFLSYNPSRADLEERRRTDRKRKHIPKGIRAESERNPSGTRDGSYTGITKELKERLEAALSANPKLRLDLEAVNRALSDYAALPDLERHAIDCVEWLGGLNKKRVVASTMRSWLRRVRDETDAEGLNAGTGESWLHWLQKRLPGYKPDEIRRAIDALGGHPSAKAVHEYLGDG